MTEKGARGDEKQHRAQLARVAGLHTLMLSNTHEQLTRMICMRSHPCGHVGHIRRSIAGKSTRVISHVFFPMAFYPYWSLSKHIRRLHTQPASPSERTHACIHVTWNQEFIPIEGQGRENTANSSKQPAVSFSKQIKLKKAMGQRIKISTRQNFKTTHADHGVSVSLLRDPHCPNL